MYTFKDKLWSEYPVPKEYSIFGGNTVITHPIADLDALIASSVDEVASDILLNAYVPATGPITYMPKDCVTCSSAQISPEYPYQGNRNVKVSYDKSSNKAFLNYYPAVITYKKKLDVAGLDELSGDRLIYCKMYILWKMAAKELTQLKTVNMNIDNGVVNFDELEKFRENCHSAYLELKKEILIYSTVN